jgi:hypothetical protein
MSRAFVILLTLVAATAACASYPAVVEQETDVALLADSTAAADSAVYAAFLETLNRDPRNDTLHVESMSKIFVRLPSHYDSVAPGLNAALARVSKEQRPTSSLHLPPPVRVLPPALVIALSNADVLNSLGAVEGRPQGISGLWTFTPVAYSPDGKDAMFSYTAVCGRRCGEDVVVWARKNAEGKWEVRKTAILSID